MNVRVALGSTFDDEPELLKEIVVLDPDGMDVGKPGTTPIDCRSVGDSKLVSLSGMLTFSSVHLEGR